MYPPITYLTDCYDSNAQARLSTRISALFGQSPVIIPIDSADPESYAALTLLDCLRATELLGEAGQSTIILLNIAPRDGQWRNGVPFCYFTYGQHLVVSTLNTRVLAQVRKHIDIKQINVTDIRQVLTAANGKWAHFSTDELNRIVTTQFRSLWYLPLLAKWVTDQQPVPSTLEDILEETNNDADLISVIDNFGNCKLNAQADDLGFKPGLSLPIRYHDKDGQARIEQVTCYSHLTEVPQGQPGLIPGSSGVDFIELVIRGGSAAKKFGLRPGDKPLQDPVLSTT